ncbi:maleylacetate reductase [Inquilinus sp. Marseille-Q2685]|uniref:maleylacetate reductase n=1 Tax=Inquilinus sp. Marseille-Q2685 TaxID=2866581 RepID=UPI001CE46F68|nr:maleylacetate reductase [Inquilinus sp. Marseille-Q2685]
MQSFVYEALPSRVIFGSGALAHLGDEIDRLGVRRALVLSTPPQCAVAKELAASLGGRCVGVFSDATMHTPVEVTDRAMARVLADKVDGVIAIGGGSTTGLGKAIAFRTDLPQVVVPTTYAGSEMTSILGETKNGLKTIQKSPKVLPETVVYDVDLTMTLPAGLSGTSGINAIAHAVEALYAADCNPVVALMAEEGIRALAGALPTIANDPKDREARSDALYGAWLCGACLGTVSMALHHKLCHTLGGTFDLPHAETHTVVLPHVIAYNAAGAPGAMGRIARALGTMDAALGMFDLAGRLGARRALRDLGMPVDGIDRAAEVVAQSPYPNPVPVRADAIRDLIARAWSGDPPSV